MDFKSKLEEAFNKNYSYSHRGNYKNASKYIEYAINILAKQGSLYGG